jgi:hypothetical protein
MRLIGAERIEPIRGRIGFGEALEPVRISFQPLPRTVITKADGVSARETRPNG